MISKFIEADGHFLKYIYEQLFFGSYLFVKDVKWQAK